LGLNVSKEEEWRTIMDLPWNPINKTFSTPLNPCSGALTRLYSRVVQRLSASSESGSQKRVFTFYLKLLKHQCGLVFPSTCLIKELEGTCKRSCEKEEKKRNFDLKDLIGAEWFGCH
jgi:hypothetical protein